MKKLILGTESQYLKKSFDYPVISYTKEIFANGEIYIRINENIVGQEIFIIKSIVNPINENLVQLLILIDAIKRAGAKRINLICPFLCYTRQDRMSTYGEPITARLVADLLTKAGVKKLFTIDLHSNQIEGFYDIPVINLSFDQFFTKKFQNIDKNKYIVVSPDVGGLKRANYFAKSLDLPLVVLNKTRKAHNQATITQIIGDDYENKNAIIFDDMIDTGGTIMAAAKVLKENKVKKIFVCATHGIFSNNALDAIIKSDIDHLYISNTIPQTIESKKITILPIVKILKSVFSKFSDQQKYT